MPSEESRQEQALALARRAREALPPELAAHLTNGVEAAVSLLTQAVERLADDSPGFTLPGDTLEQVQARIAAREAATEPKFIISFPDVELSVDEIWPPVNEESAPEHPTPQDVVEVMKNYTKYSFPATVASEWLLLERLYVKDADDASGDGQVEWDGT